MLESTEALICVDIAMFVVVLSARSENLLCGWLSTAPHRFPKSLRGKWANPALMEFTRQGQHLARIPTPDSPLNQAPVLVELDNIPQPLSAR